MKKLLIGVAMLAIAAVTAAFLYRDEIGMMIAFSRLKPSAASRQRHHRPRRTIRSL